MKDNKGHGSNGRGGMTPVQSENAPFKSRLGPQAGHSYLDPKDPRGSPPAHQAGVMDATDKGATMTRQHFEMIANTLAQHAQQVRTNPHAHDALVASFADKLGKANPKFNKAMFVKAAGGH